MPNGVKPNIIAYRLCQITLNLKLSHKFKNWHKFLSRIKAKFYKKKLCKMTLACIWIM